MGCGIQPLAAAPRDVIARLQAHKSGGAQVYIVSSVIEPMIEPFAARIGAQTIGTPVEYQNGQVRVAGELAAQERKIEKLKQPGG